MKVLRTVYYFWKVFKVIWRYGKLHSCDDLIKSESIPGMYRALYSSFPEEVTDLLVLRMSTFCIPFSVAEIKEIIG